MNTVIKRLIDYFTSLDTIGDGAKVQTCYVSRALEYLQIQRQDGSWADVDYQSTESAANGVNWGPYLALDRMQMMAIAYQKPDHPGYHNPALPDGVERGLRYWSGVRSCPDDINFEGPWSVNWWEREIGVQLRFGRIGLLLQDELSTEAIGIITRKLQKEGALGPGQNEFWRTQNALYRALITRDEEQFGKVVNTCLTTKLRIQTGAESEEAVQADYSFHGHGELFFSNGYGMALFRDMSFWMYMLRDTEYALGREQLQRITMNRYEKWADEVIEKIREKVSWSSEKNKEKFPYTTDESGNYIDRAANGDCNGLSWWTNGFWGGTMWLLYQDTKEEKYRDIARMSEERLEKCFEFFYGLNHDVGFMYMPTAVTDYRLTGNGESRRRGLHAANLLAGRFNAVGKFIRAWDGAGPSGHKRVGDH